MVTEPSVDEQLGQFPSHFAIFIEVEYGHDRVCSGIKPGDSHTVTLEAEERGKRVSKGSNEANGFSLLLPAFVSLPQELSIQYSNDNIAWLPCPYAESSGKPC